MIVVHCCAMSLQMCCDICDHVESVSNMSKLDPLDLLDLLDPQSLESYGRQPKRSPLEKQDNKSSFAAKWSCKIPEKAPCDCENFGWQSL